jgi:hypothetical protein
VLHTRQIHGIDISGSIGGPAKVGVPTTRLSGMFYQFTEADGATLADDITATITLTCLGQTVLAKSGATNGDGIIASNADQDLWPQIHGDVYADITAITGEDAGDLLRVFLLLEN